IGYREMMHDPDVARDVIALGDANPKDLAVQTWILKSSPSARSDREFIARTIERVKALTGPEGQSWKVERARWLIGSDAREKDSAEAVNLLNDVVRVSPNLTEPRVLLAEAYQNVGNLAAATKELSAAAELEPHSAPIALDLAKILQLQGRFGDARAQLERATALEKLSTDDRRRAAAMLTQQGDLAKAARTLEAAETAS